MILAAMPPIGVGPTEAPTAGGGSPLVGWIVVALVVWFFLQFLPSRARVWKRRAAVLAPVGRYLVADIKATRATLRSRPRREARLAAEKAQFDAIISDWE